MEVLPEISTEIKQIKEEMAPVETNLIMDHGQTQINQTNSVLFRSASESKDQVDHLRLSHTTLPQ